MSDSRAPTAATPTLTACQNCPATTICCTVAARGGPIEPPFLLPTDLAAIAQATRAPIKSWVEKRRNPETGNDVPFMRASRDGGCGFHDPRSGRCNIYAARPVDCRLYPLDIALIDGSYYWILRRYCDITDADLKNLIAFGEQILPQFRDRLRDYATVAVDGIDSLPFEVIRQVGTVALSSEERGTHGRGARRARGSRENDDV